MTYSALFCSEVNKFYVLLHAKLFSHTRTARWSAAMRATHHHARPSAAPSVLRWSRWRPTLLIYTHLRLQHWDIFSWSIRILRCPWCCFLGSDSDTFLIHKISWGLFWLCPSSWLLIDVGACFKKDILSQVAFSWPSRKRPIFGLSPFLTLRFIEREILFLAVLLCHHDALEVLCVDHPAVDLELAESVVDLVRRELLAPGHQWVPEPVTESSALKC